MLPSFKFSGLGLPGRRFIAMGLTRRPKIWSGLNPARVSETGCETGVGTPSETINESKEEV